MFIKKKVLYNKSRQILKKKYIIKKNLKSFLNDKYVAQLFKKDRVNYKFFNKESIDIFFKLLFLIQKKKIKLIKRILKLFFNMRLELRLYLFKRISKIFKIYFKNFLEKFLKEKKVINSNIILFRIRSSFYHLQFNKKKNTGLLFLQFPKKKKKRQTILNYVSFNKNKEDSKFYKAFFLGNTSLKWKLIKWRKLKNKYKNLKKWTRRWLFVFPFLITIKPCTIIIKNIFFKTFFIISKWMRSSKKKQARFLFNKRIKKVFYCKQYSLYVGGKKNKNCVLNNYTKIGSYFIWYTIQKLNYYAISNKLNFSVKNFNLKFLKNDLILRKLKNLKKQNWNKKLKIRHWKFLKMYKNQYKSSFIDLSFFLRLYNLYFFWFLYFFNKLFYYFNKVVFNLWFRFFYYIKVSININDNTLFYNFSILYKNLNLIYNTNSFFEFENILIKYLSNINNIWFKNLNFMILKNLNSNFYKSYRILMYYFFFRNYFLLNIYYNYSKYLINIRNKSFSVDNEFFDSFYKGNYSYKVTRNFDYYTIKKRVDLKYFGYFEKNEKKFKKMSINEKTNYMNLLIKRQNCLFLK